jgi:hypothetical protein
LPICDCNIRHFQKLGNRKLQKGVNRDILGKNDDVELGNYQKFQKVNKSHYLEKVLPF